MGSYSGGGSVKLHVDEEELEFCEISVPEIEYSHFFEEYFPQFNFSWSAKEITINESNDLVTTIKKCEYTELKAKFNDGSEKWVDGRNAPYEGTFDGTYTKEAREVTEYIITIYNIGKMTKKEYVIREDDKEEPIDYENSPYFLKKIIDKKQEEEKETNDEEEHPVKADDEFIF